MLFRSRSEASELREGERLGNLSEYRDCVVHIEGERACGDACIGMDSTGGAARIACTWSIVGSAVAAIGASAANGAPGPRCPHAGASPVGALWSMADQRGPEAAAGMKGFWPVACEDEGLKFCIVTTANSKHAVDVNSYPPKQR